MKLESRIDATLVKHILGAMTVGMKGEVFASLVLSDLGCAVTRRCPDRSCRFESVVMNIMLPS